MSIALKRDYEVYISVSNTTPYNQNNTVKLLVTDFSFNQPVNAENFGRETMDPTQERTVDPYITTVSPVTFSLTTYILPLVDTNVTSPEEYLWTSLMGSNTISNTPTQSTIDFADGNVGSLHELTLWFSNPNNADSSYRMNNAIIDSARIDFNINGIATIEWSGRALSMTRTNPPPPASVQDRTDVSECLKNRLSTITMLLGGEFSYTLALTGGSIDIENNNKFYGRMQLGKTTVPVGHYTGNREIKGNLEFYLKQGTNLSSDLYEQIRNNMDSDNYESLYYADITINIGGSTTPYIQLTVPRAVLELPRINFEEALTMAVPFTAREETGQYSTVVYYAT